ncbi:MAG: hypothetical protein JW722_01250 [Demequinaceae bacterium]|nr:hypothetical protein [Demequinaceae bacterium]
MCENRGISLEEMSDEEMAGISPALKPEVREALTVEAALASRDGVGGTAPARVVEQGKAARARVRHFRPWSVG